MKNHKFDYREKFRDFVIENWPGIFFIITATIISLTAILN